MKSPLKRFGKASILTYQNTVIITSHQSNVNEDLTIYEYFSKIERIKRPKVQKIVIKDILEHSEIVEAEVETDRSNNCGNIPTAQKRIRKPIYFDLNLKHPVFEAHFVRKEPNITSWI